MSAYREVATTFTDQELLLKAFEKMATRGSLPWDDTIVQVHETPSRLKGYQGDLREEVAHIVIPKEAVGRSSNDIGFLKQEDGTYKAIVSRFDRNYYNNTWMDKLKQNYALAGVERNAAKNGYKVKTEERAGKIHVRLTR